MNQDGLYNSLIDPSSGLTRYNPSVVSTDVIPSPMNSSTINDLVVTDEERLSEQSNDLRSSVTRTTTSQSTENKNKKTYPPRWSDEDKPENSSSPKKLVTKTDVKKIIQPNLDKIVIKEFLPRTSQDPNFPVLRELFVRSFDHFYREIESKLKINTGQTLVEWLEKTFDEMQDEMLHRKCRCFILCISEESDESNPSGVYGFLTLKEEPNGPVYIAQCAINPIIKRKGYGSRLLLHLREVYPRGTHYVGLCRRANEPAIQFYLKIGAKFIDSQEIAEKYHYDPELYTGFQFQDELIPASPRRVEEEDPLLKKSDKNKKKTTKCCRLC